MGGRRRAVRRARARRRRLRQDVLAGRMSATCRKGMCAAVEELGISKTDLVRSHFYLLLLVLVLVLLYSVQCTIIMHHMHACMHTCTMYANHRSQGHARHRAWLTLMK